jgi:ankyrin repeat protein
MTALHLAAAGDQPDITAALIRRKADLNRPDRQGCTPLMLAVESGSERSIVLLVERGADPKVKNKEGKTALDLAREKRLGNVVEYLERKMGKP